MASSPSPAGGQIVLHSEADSQLSSLVIDLSQQVQVAMENMLKMISDIDENSNGISEDITKCKEGAFERKRTIDEQKESFQKAAFTVLDMLSKNM